MRWLIAGLADRPGPGAAWHKPALAWMATVCAGRQTETTVRR